MFSPEFPFRLFFTLFILKNHSSSLSAIFALPGFSQEIKHTYYRELSVAAVCTYYIVISFNHKRLNIPSDLTHLLVFCTFKFCQQILLEKACDYSADKHTRYFWTWSITGFLHPLVILQQCAETDRLRTCTWWEFSFFFGQKRKYSIVNEEKYCIELYVRTL